MARAGRRPATSTRCSSWTSATVEPSLAGPRRPQDRVAARRQLPDELPRLGVTRRPPPASNGADRRRRRAGSPARRRPDGDRAATAASSRSRSGGRPPTSGTARWPSPRSRRARTPRTRRSWSAPGSSPGTPSPAACRSPRPSRRRSRPGSKAVTGYLERGRADGAARDARVRARGLRLHDVHRQLRPARRADRRGRSRPRAGRRGRAVGQPQLRGPDPSARPGRVPRLAAARRRVRARRAASTSTSPRSRWARAPTARPVMLADIWPTPGRDPRGHRRVRSTRSCSARPTRSSSRATSAGARCRSPTGDRYAWDAASTYIAKPPFFDGLTLEPAPVARHRRRPRPGASSATR